MRMKKKNFGTQQKSVKMTKDDLTEVIKSAVKDYYDRHGIAYNPDEFCSGDCACCHAHDSGNGV